MKNMWNTDEVFDRNITFSFIKYGYRSTMTNITRPKVNDEQMVLFT